MNPVRSYLRLSGPYGSACGLSWRVDDNVVERNDASLRTVWAFAEEIAEFLEGFAGQRRIIHFEHVLHLFQLLRQAPPNRFPVPGRARLWRLFAEHGDSRRHAGAFCAKLCHEVPDAVEADSVAAICQRLRQHDVMIRWFLLSEEGDAREPSSWAPLSPEVFEDQVIAEMEHFSDDEVRDWLRHGRGPVRQAAAALANELPIIPEVPLSLIERLTRMLQRPRLRGARAFVEQLTGALALPPRRLTYQDLPLGGFTDVTTRGKIEDVLPSQFALDEVDFFRRYAEHELLFFRREDPNTQVRQDLVVLLDQGVRTWGDVRVVLTAAVLALAKQAERRHCAFLLSSTGAPGPIEPMRFSDDELTNKLEATDLSLNPSATLNSLLRQPVDCPRDIVLLTHPRNLREEEFRTAAKEVRAETRLFALALDRLGLAELSELHHGIAVPVRQFQVDFGQARQLETDTEGPVASANFTGWTGDVEPIAFPFGFGIHGQVPPEGFDFDGQEQHLLTACKHGLLHLWNLDGSLREILPRPLFKGRVVTDTAQVLGVADGFAVLARAHGQWLAAHYRLSQRDCRVHVLGYGVRLQYSAEHHCLLAVMDNQEAGCVIDLSTGDRLATKVGAGTERTRAAWGAWERGEVPMRKPPIVPHDQASRHRHVTVNPHTGRVFLEPAPVRGSYLLHADGKPILLHDHHLHEAQVGGNTVVLQTIDKTRKSELVVFRLNGTPLGAVPTGAPPLAFRLSSGGTMLARQRSGSAVLFGPALTGISYQTVVGGFAQRTQFFLGKEELCIIPGTQQFQHRLRWTGGVLTHALDRVDVGKLVSSGLVNNKQRDMPFYDTARWNTWAQNDKLIVAGDRYGHLAVFDRQLVLLCMFMAFRNRLAGWLPDGSYFGPMVMTGKPPRAEWARRFGRVLSRVEP